VFKSLRSDIFVVHTTPTTTVDLSHIFISLTSLQHIIVFSRIN